MKWIIVMVLILCLTVTAGCLTASSMTGSGAETTIKGDQKSSQETKSKDTTELFIERSVITVTDSSGKIITVISTGGGHASTGSQTIQEANNNNNIEVTAKAASEAASKATANITPLLLIILVVVLIFSGLPRIMTLVKKAIKPL